MKLPLTALLVVAGLMSFAFAQQSNWIAYKSAEGRYSVSFPSEPQLKDQEAATSVGDKVTQHLAYSLSAKALYMIGYFDAQGREFSFDGARDGMIKNVKGTLVAEKDIKLGDYPGRELRVSAKTDAGAPLIYRVRYYRVNQRIYCVLIQFEASDENAVGGEVSSFLESFHAPNP